MTTDTGIRLLIAVGTLAASLVVAGCASQGGSAYSRSSGSRESAADIAKEMREREAVMFARRREYSKGRPTESQDGASGGSSSYSSNSSSSSYTPPTEYRSRSDTEMRAAGQESDDSKRREAEAAARREAYSKGLGY